MNGLAYYNEFDDFCADWLEALIEKGLIAPGIVDRRSILDIKPSDLVGYTQCHFFAGIGIFSRSLRESGWPDDRPIWSGSCPCQPLSSAGKRLGFADGRHLWPAFFYLIKECRPPIVIGEQVSSPDALVWLDLVQDDMEGEGYAFGALDTSAAGSGLDFAQSEEGQTTIEWIHRAVLSCPDPFVASELRDFAAWAGTEISYGPAHIRQRLYWVAHTQRWTTERHGYSLERASGGMQSAPRQQRVWTDVGNGGTISGVANNSRDGWREERQDTRGCREGNREKGESSGFVPGSDAGAVADANGGNASTERKQRGRKQRRQSQDGSSGHGCDTDRELADSTEQRSLPGTLSGLHSGEKGIRAWNAEPERCRSAHKLANSNSEIQGGRGICGSSESNSESGGSTRERSEGLRALRSELDTGVTLGDAYDGGSQGWSQRGDGTYQLPIGPPSMAGSDWIICIDGKARQTESGIQPLVNDWRGPSRISVLRASGNSLVKAQAVKFIKAVMECV